MSDSSDVPMDAVRRLLVAVVTDAYMAAGVGEGCSYLLCTVSTGPRELDLMIKYSTAVNENGLRTKNALEAWLKDNGLWKTEFVDGVLRPNAADAARHASSAREALRARGTTDLVIDPSYLDVKELGLALDPPLDVDFPREAYLTVNGRVFEQARRVIFCPNAEYGSGVRTDLVAALHRGVELMDPDGAAMTVDDVRALVGDAAKGMASKGFTQAEIDAYIPPWRL